MRSEQPEEYLHLPPLSRMISLMGNTLNLYSQSYSGVSVPTVSKMAPKDNPFFEVTRVWTRDSLRPRWGNIAVAAGQVTRETPLKRWENLAEELTIPIVALAVDKEHATILESNTDYQGRPKQSRQRTVSFNDLAEILFPMRHTLFSPRALAAKRGGQLSFADLEEVLSPDSFSNYARSRARLEVAVRNALQGAIKAQLSAISKSESPNAKSQKWHIAAVLEVTIAYLAARILQDKGFFDTGLLINDPAHLLYETIKKTNGFFKHAYEIYLPAVEIEAQQIIASNLGAQTRFDLVDHVDIGRLYELALLHAQDLYSPNQVQSEDVTEEKPLLEGLQQHYTPLAIAYRMLDNLPIERLRPEERVVFDPAAGSGSLLLAATRRLGGMPDANSEQLRNADYLATHVIGNDLDPTAKLITELRYKLVQQTFATHLNASKTKSNQTVNIFPFPTQYRSDDYENSNTWRFSQHPRVVVANPPFEQVNSIQKASAFVTTLMEELREGDQFAIILPDVFLSGNTRKWPEARASLAERCRIFEVWQLPERSIGLVAQQAVCVILGEVFVKSSLGHTQDPAVIARAVLTRTARAAVREEGFLGKSWIAQLSNLDPTNWQSVSSPTILIPVRTIALQSLFYVAAGVIPRAGVRPVGGGITDADMKPFWKGSWREPGSLWADPRRVLPEERWIPYSSKYLKQMRAGDASIYQDTKVLLSYSSNRASKDVLGACFDSEGYVPSQHLLCVTPHSKELIAGLQDHPSGWESLSREESLYWLLGIMASDFASDIAMQTRSSRHTGITAVRKFPLPASVDMNIIETVKQILKLERTNVGSVDERAKLKKQLDKLVFESYGSPNYTKLQRTGKLPEMKEKTIEHRRRSYSVTGLVSQYNVATNQVYLHLNGFTPDEGEAWVTLPAELPGWALDGTVFSAEISADVHSIHDLNHRLWALRHFKHTPSPYLSINEVTSRILQRLGVGDVV